MIEALDQLIQRRNRIALFNERIAQRHRAVYRVWIVTVYTNTVYLSG